MRLMLVLASGLGVAALSATPSVAQEQKNRQRPRFDAAFFERLDTNKDGVITLDEIPEERREQAKQLVERLDADKDGKVTRKEFDAAIERVTPRPDQPNERRPDSRPNPGSPEPQNSRRGENPARPDETRPPGQPPIPDGPGRPPFAFGGPDLFRALDMNNDGKLSREELAKAAETLMKHDRNEDGAVSPEELAEALRSTRPGPGPGSPPPGAPAAASPEIVANMIRRADKNGDGKLSKDEAPEMMRGRFDEMDANKDGFLDREELARAGERLRRLREESGNAPRLPGRPGAGAPPGRPGAGGPGRPGGEANIVANRDRIAAMLRERDKDADGRISAAEFPTERADEFKRLDTNNDGYVTPDELARSLPARDERPAADRRRNENPESKKDESDK